MHRDKATLLDIAAAARLVLEFTEGMDKAGFLDDIKTQSSVLHQLMVLGEAVKRLSGSFRVQHPEVPWTLIAGMRDKLIHGYDIVDLEEVWETVSRDVPDLLRWLEPRLPKEE
ncbi:MAG: DUF86 domain-containing protein [Anaerolineae bacterium]|jgi:uncharacterized protein with HEPN domain